MSKSYHVTILPKAQKELDGVSEDFFKKIDKEIKSLSSNPRPFGVKKLDKDLHRIRVGPFRVIYLILEKEEKVVILHVSRRNEKTYRNL